MNPTETNFSISNLPIVTKPEWSNIVLGKDYNVTFKFIGDRILLTIPEGNSENLDIDLLYRHRNNILKDHLGEDTRFLEIKDYSKIFGIPSQKLRKKQIEFFKNDTGKIIAFIAYDLQQASKLMMTIGLRANTPDYPFHIVDNYSLAVKKALSLLENYKKIEFLDTKNFITKAEWLIKGHISTVEVKIIPERIFFVSHIGFFQGKEADKGIAIQEQIFKDGYFKEKNYYRIADYTNMTGSTWSARWQYLTVLEKIYKQYSKPLVDYIIGETKLQRIVINSARKILGLNMIFVSSLNEAFEMIAQAETKVKFGFYPKEKTLSQTKWIYQDTKSDFEFKAVIWRNNILYEQYKGALKKDHIDHILTIINKALEQPKLKNNNYYHIIDLTKCTEFSSTVYKEIETKYDKINKKLNTSSKNLIFCGNTKQLSLASISLIGLEPSTVAFAKNIKEAIKIIDTNKQTLLSKILQLFHSKSKSSLSRETEEILNHIADISIDPTKQMTYSTPETPQFKDIHELLELLRIDITQILAKQKEFNQQLNNNDNLNEDTNIE